MNRLLFVSVILLSSACNAPKQDLSKPQVPGPSFTLTPEQITDADLQTVLENLEKDPHNPLLNRQAGVIYQRLSPPDRWSYLDDAIRYLNTARLHLGDDPQTLIYLGLAKAARGMSPKLNPFKRLSSANEGFAHMDQAVLQEPNNAALRILRAKSALLAPAFLGRGAALASDHAWLNQWVQGDKLNPHLNLRALIFLGDYEDRRNKDRKAAQELWRQAANLAGDDPQGAIARSRLGGSQDSF